MDGGFQNRFTYGSGMPPSFDPKTNGATRGAGGHFEINDEYAMRFREAQRMLGPPPKLTPSDPRGEVPREIDMLPEYWKDHIPAVAEQIILMENTQLQAVLTEVAPMRLFTGNPVFKGRKMIFNENRPDSYTHTGVPRSVYHSFKEWDTAIDRRGLGLEMEAEFFGTPKGTMIFQYSIRQIQIAIVQSAAVDVLHACLRASPIPKHFYEARKIPMPVHFIKAALQPELDQWSVLTKNKYGLMDLWRDVKQRIRAVRGTQPNICIVPEWFKDHARTHCPALTEYSQRGERGPTAFDNNTVLSQQLGGLRIIESPVIRGDDANAPPEEPLEHPRTIGEHWYNSGSHLSQDFGGNGAAYLAARAFTIHNNTTDSFHTIGMQKIRDYLKGVYDAANGDSSVANALSNIDTFVKLVTAAEGNNADAIKALNQWTVILLRPFMTYTMASGIFLPGGGKAIETRVGFGDFRLGFDAARKKVLGHYTTYMGPVVVDPDSIYVAHNIAAREYLGGGGVILGEDIFVVVTKTEEDPAVIGGLQCLCIDENGFPASVFDSDANLQMYNHYAEWARLYGFPSGKPVNNMLDIAYNGELAVNTRTMLATGFMPTVRHDLTIIHPRGQVFMGNGHWGPIVYPGVREDRLGRGVNGCVTAPQVLGA